VIAEALLALVGALVFFVDDDHTEIFERCKERGTCAHGDPVAEAGTEASHDLMGERDLGHEHERLTTLEQGAGHRAQVDLRLAAAGDAMQEESFRASLGDGILDGVERLGLLTRELDDRRLVESRLGRERSEPTGDVYEAAPRQLGRGAGRAGHPAFELGGGQGAALERSQNGLLARSASQLLERSVGVEASRPPGHLHRARSHACSQKRARSDHQPVRLEGREELPGTGHEALQHRRLLRRARQLAEQGEGRGGKCPSLEGRCAEWREREALDGPGCRARRERSRQSQAHRTQDPGRLLA
jgi:hypothetical protein